MSCIIFLITITWSNTNDFNALISVGREGSLSFRSWIRVTYFFVKFTLWVFNWNNGIDCGSSYESESADIITESSIK